MSSRSLNEAEVSLLKKGLNFAVTSAKIPATQIIAKVESVVRHLDAERADTVRRAVNTILQQAEPPKPNITREQQDNSIMVLQAGKGRANVVLESDTYHAKMSTLIELKNPLREHVCMYVCMYSGPYQLLNEDLTDSLTRKLSQMLPTLKHHGHISVAVYNKTRPGHKQPLRIYSLPKIHKANTPLRPTVFCVNTFAYDLSAFSVGYLP